MYNSLFLALLNSRFLLPDDDYFSLKYTLLSLIVKKPSLLALRLWMVLFYFV